VFEYLWNLKVMPSTQIYVWMALSDRITTNQNLHKRCVTLGDTLCVLCGWEEESTSHILVSCKVSIKVWNMCFSWHWISSVNHMIILNSSFVYALIKKTIDYGKAYGSRWYGEFGSIETRLFLTKQR